MLWPVLEVLVDLDYINHMYKNFIYCHFIPLLLTIGCGSSVSKNESDYIPLENGFGCLLQSKEIYPMHKAAMAGLVYSNTNGNKFAVWSCIDGVFEVQITNNIAVFVGGKTEESISANQKMGQRLIAFEAPYGPPLDITDEVLENYCSKNNCAITNIVKNSFTSLTKTNDLIKIEFVIIKNGLRGKGSVDADGGTEIISWRNIEAIMADVKKNGKLKKEKQSGIEYLQKE
jgi:hypothetical protein